MRDIHLLFLFLRNRRIWVDAKHEREKCIEEFLPVICIHPREKFFQTAGKCPHGTGIHLFKRYQIFQPAVPFHIIDVHGHQPEHALPCIQSTGKRVCEA